MDCRCNCCGIAASSRRPVKRYNLLVPDIFPQQAPELRPDGVDASTQRKIKKLCEYLERNPHRGPKISRRLARRVNKELAAGRLGYVQVAVAAYAGVLDWLGEAGSLLAAKELVRQRVARQRHFYSRLLPRGACFCSGQPLVVEPEPRLPSGTRASDHSVVGVLLRHPEPEAQALGAQLLQAFLRQQVSAEALAQASEFTHYLCEAALDRSAGEAGKRLRLAALAALREQIRLCSRAARSLAEADAVMDCLLESLPAPGAAAAAAEGGPPAADGQAAEPRDEAGMAAAAFEDLCLLAQAPAEGRKLVRSLLRCADARGCWAQPPGSAQPLLLLRQTCRDEHQSYQAFSLLLAHAAAPGLTAPQRAAVVAAADQLGTELPAALATAALVLAIKELAPQLAGLEAGAQSEALRQAVLACIAHLAARLPDAQHLLAALGGIAAKLPVQASQDAEASRRAAATLACMAAAAGSLAGRAEAAAAQAGREALPGPLLRQMAGVLLTCGLTEQAQAHAVLAAALGRGGCALRASQVPTLLSAVWHQVTAPGAQAVPEAGGTLRAAAAAAPLRALASLAAFAGSLQQAAAAAEGELSPSQRLALLQLGQLTWTVLAERPDTKLDAAQLLLPLSAEGSTLAPGDQEAGALAEACACVQSPERQEAVRGAVLSLPGGTDQPFEPLPLAELLPQELGALAARAKAAGQRLRVAVQARGQDGRGAAATGNSLRTVAGVLQAAEAQRRSVAGKAAVSAEAAAEAAASVLAQLGLPATGQDGVAPPLSNGHA